MSVPISVGRKTLQLCVLIGLIYLLIDSTVCSLLSQRGLNRYPFHVFTSFSTVSLRRYMEWTASEEPLLSRLQTVEAVLMTSLCLQRVLFSTCTQSLVSFQFHCCLILFECQNKCESVCLPLQSCSFVQTPYKDVEGLTSNVCFDDVIVFHLPDTRSQPGKLIKQDRS